MWHFDLKRTYMRTRMPLPPLACGSTSLRTSR
nr:MAG TPA: hypothetical protein [Caudoviricetes sp.]